MTSHTEPQKDIEGFPLSHYSYSAWTKFATNPFMFKVNNINGDYIETTSTAGNVLGKIGHKALEALFKVKDVLTIPDGDAIKIAHDIGIEFMKSYSDGLIEWTDSIESRAKLEERFAFAFFGYIKGFDYKKEVKEILLVEKMLKHRVRVGDKVLPVPLKGSADLVYRDYAGLLKVRDHKFTGKHSSPEELEAAKLIQAAFNYFLVYAELGEAPYSMIYAEFKITENRDKAKPQLQEYEIVYAQNPLIFDLFYRLYGDITDALMGKQVYIPNFSAFYDKEVSLLAYIHRLDVEAERVEILKKNKVENITDFLKKKIQSTGSMKKYLDTVSKKFVSAKTMNYKDMKVEERIRMKLAEHGLGVEFHDKIVGGSVVLYRYEPSIGLKMTKIEAFAKDIEQVVETSDIRVLAPIRDSGLIGFEVPTKERRFPSPAAHSGGFNLAIGVDIMGNTRYFDIRKAPHMLVAGSSGSGKSVFLNAIIKQLLNVSEARLYLFDPKQVELGQFEGMGNVADYQHKHEDIVLSLKRLAEEMELRYSAMKAAKVRNIEGMPGMPYLIAVIDEFADLTMKSEVSSIIQILAQKGRAAGIHIIIATQRASVKIISGDIKVNFPIKVVFKMDKEASSRVMLDEGGAEKLLGKGDMLFASDAGIERLQGFNA